MGGLQLLLAQPRLLVKDLVGTTLPLLQADDPNASVDSCMQVDTTVELIWRTVETKRTQVLPSIDFYLQVDTTVELILHAAAAL